MRKIDTFVWKQRRKNVDGKVGNAWEKIGRAGLYAAVQQKPAGTLCVFRGGMARWPLAIRPWVKVQGSQLYSAIYSDYAFNFKYY